MSVSVLSGGGSDGTAATSLTANAISQTVTKTAAEPDAVARGRAQSIRKRTGGRSSATWHHL